MTYGPVKANCQITTISVTSSGDVTTDVLKSDQCYSRVSVVVTPLGDGPDYKHTVTLYLDGVEQETHEYTDDDELNITRMTYEKAVYPPTLWGTQPGLNGLDPGIAGFTVKVENAEDNIRTFMIHSTFEVYETSSYKLTAK